MKYYSARLEYGGHEAYVDYMEWTSIHETPTFHYCIEMIWVRPQRLEGKCGLDALRFAKEQGYRIKRIDKRKSRFGFETKEKALENLKYLKHLQLGHLERTKRLITEFLAKEEVVKND